MAELDFISKFSGEEIDNILDKSQELLNKGYTFSGVATPETDPGTPSLKVFYLTTTAGKYANFDNITVESGKLTVLLYNGSMWQNQVLDLPTSSEPEVNVVQTIGNSTTAVMSQNAVTEELLQKVGVDAVVDMTGNSSNLVMSQASVTEELSKKASVESVTDGISAHNTSSTSHADIRELLNTCVGLPAYDSSSYKITFTTLAGASVEIDLPIEQLALRYNAETESIEFDNADGTTTSIPVSAFVKEYVGSIGDRIQISIDENNVIHATILKNSIDWGCLSFELQERINDHVTSADFATKAVRTDIAQSLSLAAQNQALENIGADLVRIPYSLLGTTLSDEMFAVVDNARGIILVDTPNAFILPTIYNKGRTTSTSAKFIAIGEVKDVYYISYNKNTKALANVVHTYTDTGCVRYNQAQDLTTSQQDTALSNIGLNWIHVSYSLLNTVLDDDTYTKLTSAFGIILSDAPSEYYGPLEFICGANNGDGTKVFVGLNLANTSAYIALRTNHRLTNVSYLRTYDGAVPYDASKTLTNTQKQQARTNIGVQSADELLADDDFIAQLKTKLGIA